LGIAHCVGGNHDEFSIQFCKLGVVLAQLRQMPAAERSHKTTQEYQDDMFSPPEVF
jgi:hypothetical protein